MILNERTDIVLGVIVVTRYRVGYMEQLSIDEIQRSALDILILSKYVEYMTLDAWNYVQLTRTCTE